MGRDRNGLVTATANGPVRFTADGYYAEEATTNLVPNPRAGVAANYWGSTTTGVTVARRTDDGVTAMTCFEVVCDGLSVNQGIGMNSLSAQVAGAGVVVTASVYARLVSGTPTLQLEVVERGAGVEFLASAPQTIAVDSTWTRFTMTYTTTDAACYALQVRVRQPTGGPATASTFRVTDVQLEQKAHATSYCDGSLGTGYSWAGTAHASASSRAAAALQVATAAGRVSTQQGSIMARLHPTARSGAHNFYLFAAGNYGSAGEDFVSAKTVAWGGFFRTGTASAVSLGTTAPPLNVDNLGYLEWDDTAVRWQLNGGTMGSGVRDDPTGVVAGTIDIGQRFSQYFNGYITDVMIFDRPLTTQERAYLAATPEWSFGVLADRIIPGLLLPV